LEELNGERDLLIRWLAKLQPRTPLQLKLPKGAVGTGPTESAPRRRHTYGPDNPHWTQLPKNRAKMRRVLKEAKQAAIAAAAAKKKS
jgi:hypothetical protein